MVVCLSRCEGGVIQVLRPLFCATSARRVIRGEMPQCAFIQRVLCCAERRVPVLTSMPPARRKERCYVRAERYGAKVASSTTMQEPPNPSVAYVVMPAPPAALPSL